MTMLCCTTHTQCDSQAGKALEMSRNHNREQAEIQLLVLGKSFGQSEVPKSVTRVHPNKL